MSLARQRGVHEDAGIRQDLVRLHTLSELGRFNGLRAKAVAQRVGLDSRNAQHRQALNEPQRPTGS